jgi:hypothetical protein
LRGFVRRPDLAGIRTAPLHDRFLFDSPPSIQDCLTSTIVHILWRQIIEVLVVTPGIVAVDELTDTSFQITLSLGHAVTYISINRRIRRAGKLLRPDILKIVAACALLSPFVSAYGDGFWSQFVDPEDGRFDASVFLADNAYGFLPVPIIITDPAVDGGLGVVGLFFHETDEQKEARLKALRTSEDGARYLLTPSVSAAAVAVTGNDSRFVGGGHMGFFKQGRIRYMGGGGYGDVNLDFFGFGEVTLTRPVELNTRAAAIIQNVRFRLGNTPIFLGPVQRFVSARIEPKSLGDLSGEILPPDLQERWQEIVRRLLTQDVVTSGLGVVAELDTRDNFFSPHEGYYLQLEHLLYRDFLGSDIDYQLTTLDSNSYWKISERFRAGLRLALDYADTDRPLPPFSIPFISLRGIPAVRYQGNIVVATEAELAWQFDDRWTLLGFAGIGRAANESSQLDDAPSRTTRGAGFRYLIARRYGFEMGVDVARGPEETVFYVQAGTAWR